MALFRAGVAFGIELFLIADMAIVHQLLRLHGILFSIYFEDAVLVISTLFATRSLLRRDSSLLNPLIWNGILAGFGATLFLDVVVVDVFLKLHSVNYSEEINIGTGMIGLILVVGGLHGWRHLRNLHASRKTRFRHGM